MSVRARSIVITGANRGIGLEMVRQLVSSDTPPQHLFATCRDPDAATDLNDLAKANSAVQIVKFDVRNEAEYPSFVEKVRSQVGDNGLNMLINNAGLLRRDNLENITKTEMLDHFETNTIAPLLITQAFLPLLRQAAKNSTESGLSHQRASVFNMSSLMGSIDDNGSGAMYAYRSSKCALNMVTMSMHRDLSKEGILCVTLHPGWVKTEMGGPNAKTTTLDCVQGLFKVISEAKDAQGGTFINFQGKILSW